MTEASTRAIEQRWEAVDASRTFQHICKTYQLESKRVLDIGCSYGEFLTHFGTGSEGLTIAPEEAQYATEKGLRVRVGNVEDPLCLQSFTEPFDVVFANNIFEHLSAPHAFLINIKPLLKEGGILILGVPSVPKVTLLLRLRKFRGSLASLHINFFTRDTLRLTVERAGWIVSSVRGFKFTLPLADRLFNLVYPHFYVVAQIDPTFEYSEKRKKELRAMGR